MRRKQETSNITMAVGGGSAGTPEAGLAFPGQIGSSGLPYLAVLYTVYEKS